MTQNGAQVRAHWELRDGRTACLVPGLDIVEHEGAAPTCGACVAVLAFLGFDADEVWDGWTPPAESPSEALALLRGTPWAQMFSTDRPEGPDVWWFQDQEDQK